MSKGKVSFDFDDTIDRVDVQIFATQLVNLEYDVYMVTARCNNADRNNDSVFKVAELCGINKENVVFTCYEDKIEYLRGKEFIFHLDDSSDELMHIREDLDPCFPMSVDFINWKEELKGVLKI